MVTRRNFERSRANTITAATTNDRMNSAIVKTFHLGPRGSRTGSGGLSPQGRSARWLSPDPRERGLLHIQSVSGIEPRRLAKCKTRGRFPLAATHRPFLYTLTEGHQGRGHPPLSDEQNTTGGPRGS